jgi:hypothetical protein
MWPDAAICAGIDDKLDMSTSWPIARCELPNVPCFPPAPVATNMSLVDHGHYPPLNSLKPVANDIWVVDGPTIRFGPALCKFPFPTRMTIIRLRDGNLFIHSPTPLTPSLKREIEAIGAPRWLVGPNRLHYSWIPDWRAMFSDAAVYLAPQVERQARGRIDFDYLPLERDSGFPWDDAIDTLPIAGGYMTEVEFFHRASRTLILTDLIENFEPQKLDSFITRWLTRWGGVQDPDGQMPRDLRFVFRKQRTQLRDAVERMIAWDPQRILLAHGRWYGKDGAAELRRAFRWLLT